MQQHSFTLGLGLGLFAGALAGMVVVSKSSDVRKATNRAVKTVTTAVDDMMDHFPRSCHD